MMQSPSMKYLRVCTSAHARWDIEWTEFRNYVEQCVFALMRVNCVAGQPSWTNNNCKAMNQVIQQLVQWHSQQIPDLINKICSVVDGQFAGVERDLVGCEDFVLRPKLSRHRTTIEHWIKLTAGKRKKNHRIMFPFAEHNLFQLRWYGNHSADPRRWQEATSTQEMPKSKKTTTISDKRVRLWVPVNSDDIK